MLAESYVQRVKGQSWGNACSAQRGEQSTVLWPRLACGRWAVWATSLYRGYEWNRGHASDTNQRQTVK